MLTSQLAEVVRRYPQALRRNPRHPYPQRFRSRRRQRSGGHRAGLPARQGCINGYGERCGNANLVSIIANLELKMGHSTIGRERLATLTAAARFIAELANLPMRNDQPYVGHSRVRA